MNNHGLGHLPQPDNFTTVGNKLGIEINQYNCPINVGIVRYSTVQYSPVQYNCPINVGTGGSECRLY